MSRPRLSAVYALMALALALSLPARAQAPDPAAARAELAKLHTMLGRWEGEAWSQMGPRRDTLWQTERVESMLGGSAILVEGRGTRPGSNPPETRYQAHGVIVYDAPSRGFKLHAFRETGQAVVADVTLTDTGLIWGFTDGRGGHIRYTVTLTPDTWNEIGEYSRDRQSWMKFMEMNLKRVGGAPSP